MSQRKSKFPNRIEKDIEQSSSPAAPSSNCSMTALLDESVESIEEYSLALNEDETPQYMCRVCTWNNEDLISIFNPTENELKICEMLTFLMPQIPICSSDLLPKFICTCCLDKLFISYEFQEMCIASDEYLRGTLETKTIFTMHDQTEDTIQHESVYIEEDSAQAEKIINIIEIVKDEINDDVMTSVSHESMALEEDQIITDESSSIQKTKEEEMNGDKEIDSNLIISSDLKRIKAKRKTLTHGKGNGTADFDITTSAIGKKSIDKRKILAPNENGTNAESTIDNNRPHLPCPHCDKLFDCPDILKRHLQVYKCDLCGKEFPKTRLLALHLLTHPENQKFKCTLCAKTFPYQTRLDEHMNKHNGIKPFECGICEKSFYRKKALSTHMRTHRQRRHFSCLHCGKAFKSSGNLSQHMMVHADVKPYLCDICGASFARVAALEQHKQTHSDERPYNCDECDKSFKLLCQIKRHMKIHAGQKPHKCPLCKKAFTESNDLKKHLRRHIGEKIYKCEKCPKAFEFKKDLQKHEHDHFKEEQQQQHEQQTFLTELNIDVIY